MANPKKLVLIVDGTMPPGVVDELRSLPQVRRITL